jgi:hypothetical protein
MNVVPATKRYVSDDRFRVRLFDARRQLDLPHVLPQLRMLPVWDLVVRGVLKRQRRSAEGAEALSEISAR